MTDGPEPERVPTPDDRETQGLVTAWGMLSEAVVAVSRNLAAGLDAAGMPGLAQFDVLIRLRREPARRLPLTVIAHEVGLTSASMGKLAIHMELDGLITTAARDTASAVLFAELTERGERVTAVALGPHTDDLRRHLLGPLGPDGLNELTVLTRRLRDGNP